jgi:hypothetical protein
VYPRNAVIILITSIDLEHTKAKANIKLKDPENAVNSERMSRIVLKIKDNSMHL